MVVPAEIGLYGATATETGLVLIHGACHCRNISFSLTLEPDPVEIVAGQAFRGQCLNAWTSVSWLGHVVIDG